jgi:hypothetical protein
MDRRLRKVVCVFGGLLLFSLLSAAQEDELLKVESSINPRQLSRGQEGKIILKLSIKEGIIISPLPDFIIEFTPQEDIVFPKNFFTASDLNLGVLEEGGESAALDLSKPVEIPFTISLQAKRGSHILDGRIKYFARSREEDWCLKSSAKFSASFSTWSSVAKKK